MAEPPKAPLTVNMRTTITLLEVFVVAVVLAFVVTVASGTLEMQALAAGLIIPIILLSVVFIRYCRLRKFWSFAGATILGVLGVALSGAGPGMLLVVEADADTAGIAGRIRSEAGEPELEIIATSIAAGAIQS